MAHPTNANILSVLETFRKESSQQREEILSGINDLNSKVAVQNGRVGRLEEETRGPEGHHRRIRDLEHSHWKMAGAVAVVVVLVEAASHLVK